MKITDVRIVEDCFDGSRVLRYEFDAPWIPVRIRALEVLGDLDYFSDFPRPLFRVRTPDGAELKGVEGETDCQIVYPAKEREQVQTRIEALLASMDPTPPSATDA